MEQRSAASAALAVDSEGGRRRAWMRHWEFWLAVALGAFLRLWRLDLTQYLDDQTLLMRLARLSATHGWIPLTGIPSSIHTLNPPLSVYLLLPFAALTADPMPVVVSIALWNVIGVALSYLFTLRYFGRRIAAVSALLFATCGAAINYSRFIWQQNYLPPLLILWTLTLFLGCVEGRRRWFAGNVTLLGLAALLHPTAALLAPVTLVGVALAPRVPRLRAWIAAAVALLALAAPTILWEALSGFSDVHAVRQYTTGHSRIDLMVLYYLYQAIGGPLVGGPTTRLLLGALNVVATALFAVGWLTLTARVIRPARALQWRRVAGLIAAARDWSGAFYRGLRADALWRSRLLLWLCVTLPPALMLRHNGALFAHYLMILYPMAFIVSAMGADDLIKWIMQKVNGRAGRSQAVLALALEVALLALMVGRSAQWISYPQSLTDAQTFDAYHDYGYPLSVAQGGAATLDRLQARTGATNAEVVTAADVRYRYSEEYLFVGDRTNRLATSPDCLAMPTTPAESWLVTSVYPHTPALSLLRQLPNAESVGSLAMIGGPTYPVYQVTGPSPMLPNEQSLVGVTTPQPPDTSKGAILFADGQGNVFSLLGADLSQPGELMLRWQVVSLHVDPDTTHSVQFSITSGHSQSSTVCEAQHLRAGETLFTWVALPATRSAYLDLYVTEVTTGYASPRLGPVRFASELPTKSATVEARATITSATSPSVVGVVDGGLRIAVLTSSRVP